MEWVYSYINDLFDKFGEKAKSISSLPIEESITKKSKHLKDSLLKFYAPTIENLSDVSNQLLWLASPTSFNDPKDSQIAIADNFEAYCLMKLVADSPLFSPSEKGKIYQASTKNAIIHMRTSNYFPILYSKEEKIRNQLEDRLRELRWKVNGYIKELQSTNYRVACFSQKDYNLSNREQLMWAHYAQNFKGFCVEYDVEQIFSYNFKDYSFCDFSNGKVKLGCLHNSQLKQLLINGFFPVIYKSRQISLPAATAYYIATGKCCKRYLNNTQILFLKSLITKDLVWKYEQEWRLIVDESLIKNIEYKIPFPFAKSIYMGDAASPELKLMLQDIAKKLNIPCHGSKTNSYYGF